MTDRALRRLLVLAAVLAAFAPVLSLGFVGWDDQPFILDNPFIRGLSPTHLRAMAGAVVGGAWMPLSWLTLAVDHAVWGLEPAGYHLTNLLLHAAAALLFFEIGRKLLKDEWAATLAALFFALHPLRVESVAWAAERKGLLAGVLILSSLYARLRSFESARARAWEAAALAAFALSLAAKPNGLTFPLALIALDVFLRRRPRVLAYAPYLALSAATLAATLASTRAAGVESAPLPGAAWGAGQALYGLLFYPWKTLWPAGLSPYYPPRAWFGTWSWELWALAAGAVAAIFALRGRRTAALAAASYALLILPTLGLARHGIAYAAADRFSYLSCLGFALLFGSALGKSRRGRALAAAWLTALGAATWRQCAVWRDPVSLWARTFELEAGALAEGNLGASLVNAGRADEGIARLRAAIALDPALPIRHEALGAALARAGRADEARAAWREGLAAAPSPELAAFLGASLTKDRILTGTALLRAAALARPDNAAWRADLGDALARAGRSAEAKREYAAALALDPALGRAHNNLGLLLEREGRTEDAAERYRMALRDPDSRAQAHHNRGNMLLAAGRGAEAERHYRAALRLDARLLQSQVNLGNILAGRGRYGEAANLYRSALKTDPRSIEARANLIAIARFLRK